MDSFFSSGYTGPGELVRSFSDVFLEVWHGSSHTSVTPMTFKRVMGKYAPHLAGFSQQDAQEFVIFLLNGLCEDLHGRGKPREEVVKEEVRERWSIEKQADYWWDRHQQLNSR